MQAIRPASPEPAEGQSDESDGVESGGAVSGLAARPGGLPEAVWTCEISAVGSAEAARGRARPAAAPPAERRKRRLAIVAGVAVVAACLGYLLTDAAQANDRYDRALRTLETTRRTTSAVVAADLAKARLISGSSRARSGTTPPR